MSSSFEIYLTNSLKIILRIIKKNYKEKEENCKFNDVLGKQCKFI